MVLRRRENNVENSIPNSGQVMIDEKFVGTTAVTLQKEFPLRRLTFLKITANIVMEQNILQSFVTRRKGFRR